MSTQAAPEFTTVAVIGTGTVGASWATLFALHGLNVRLFDAQPPALATGLLRARENLQRLVDLGLADAATATAASRRLQPASTEADALAGADFIQESAFETYEVKKPLFARLDAATAPDVILASSSSGLLISELQSVMQHPARALIAHPFNPPHLIPLVELVAGRQTAPDTIARARVFFESLGKVPVVLHREVPGHIANRLAAALWREAIDLVASGVASVEDVDKALAAGPGLRWAIMGQHMIYHLGGGEGGYSHFIDHIGKGFEEYWRSMATWTEIPPDARTAVVAGVRDEAGTRTPAELACWRDERLATLLTVLHGRPQAR